MHRAFFSHRYREDPTVLKHFGRLMIEAGLRPNPDPPSYGLNSAKLDQQLATTDAFVCVMTDAGNRKTSPYIAYEIVTSLRARRPGLVFFEDTLLERVPRGLLVRRFSRVALGRGELTHAQAIKELRSFVSPEPLPPYPAPVDQRRCLLSGLSSLSAEVRSAIGQVLAGRGYEVLDLDVESAPAEGTGLWKLASVASLAICGLDAPTPAVRHIHGYLEGSLVPRILLTAEAGCPLDPSVPPEYQRRVISSLNAAAVVGAEVDAFEGRLWDVREPSDFDRYVEDLVERVREPPVSPRASTIVQVSGDYVHGSKVAVERNLGVIATDFAQVSDVHIENTWRRIVVAHGAEAVARALGDLVVDAKSRRADASATSKVGDLEAAAAAAKNGEGSAVVRALKRAGQWALDLAIETGQSLAESVLRKALGLE